MLLIKLSPERLAAGTGGVETPQAKRQCPGGSGSFFRLLICKLQPAVVELCSSRRKQNTIGNVLPIMVGIALPGQE